jgi:hypothetical protein
MRRMGFEIDRRGDIYRRGDNIGGPCPAGFIKFRGDTVGTGPANARRRRVDR